MRTATDIYSDAKVKVFNDGNQSLDNMALIGIEIAQKEMFYFLYRKAEIEENKNLSLAEFFDKMDKEIVFP